MYHCTTATIRILPSEIILFTRAHTKPQIHTLNPANQLSILDREKTGGMNRGKEGARGVDTTEVLALA